MKLTIGENIRSLRREKNLTQEELATMLGVTYQSVSRWENDSCYPDMELLPDIAAFFGITVDKLMGADKNAEQREVERFLERFREAVSHGEINQCIAITREGVAAYPNNYALLNKLMYALFLSTDDDGNIPEWRENQLKYDGEIVTLGERIMKYCPEEETRLEATARLAFHHCEMGRKDMGRRIYETLPSLLSCRELAMHWALDKEERVENARDIIQKGYDILSHGIYLLLSYADVSDRDRILIQEKNFALADLVWDSPECPFSDGWANVKGHLNLARFYTRLHETDKAMEELRLALRYARAFDNRPDSVTVSALLAGEKTVWRKDFDTSDSRTVCEILRDKWLASSDFDSIRSTTEFQELLAEM